MTYISCCGNCALNIIPLWVHTGSKTYLFVCTKPQNVHLHQFILLKYITNPTIQRCHEYSSSNLCHQLLNSPYILQCICTLIMHTHTLQLNVDGDQWGTLSTDKCGSSAPVHSCQPQRQVQGYQEGYSPLSWLLPYTPTLLS